MTLEVRDGTPTAISKLIKENKVTAEKEKMIIWTSQEIMDYKCNLWLNQKDNKPNSTEEVISFDKAEWINKNSFELLVSRLKEVVDIVLPAQLQPLGQQRWDSEFVRIFCKIKNSELKEQFDSVFGDEVVKE